MSINAFAHLGDLDPLLPVGLLHGGLLGLGGPLGRVVRGHGEGAAVVVLVALDL